MIRSEYIIYHTFYKFYKDITVGELASYRVPLPKITYTYRKNCKDLYPIDCDKGIQKNDIIDEPIEGDESPTTDSYSVEEVPF